MRFRLLAGALLAVSVSFLSAADPPKGYPDWPVTPTVPQPMPPRPVGDVVVFGKGVLYVVQGDGNEQLLSSPPNVVKITELAGPIPVYGKFVDGTGDYELRPYDKKQVFVVERVAQGQVELLKVPKGKVERRVLGDGTDPIPPPKPKPDDPKPVDPSAKSPWDNAPGMRVMIMYQGTLSPGQHSVVFGQRVRDYLESHAVKVNGESEYFMWQPKTDVSSMPKMWQDAFNRAVQKGGMGSWMIVGSGDKWEEGPIPDGADKGLELLRKYGGQ